MMIKKVLPALFGLIFYFLCAPSPVLSQSSNFEVINLEQIDLNRDGRPDRTVFSTNFYSQKDRILVIDGAGDMLVSQDWTRSTDFINDTWIFDAGADNTAELMITFAVENKNSVAYLFFRNGALRDTFNYASPRPLELPDQTSWSLKVMAETGWVLENGKPNQNLTFFFPGCEDVHSKLRDVNNDSIPDFEVYGLISEPNNCVIADIPSGMWVNKGDQIPLDDDNRVFWPFLLGSENLEGIKSHNKFMYYPFVAVDWENGTLGGTSIGQLSSGYPIESGYFIGSFNHFYENTINKANFENPMAYYDLAGDQDGWPEMHIRLEYFNPMDPHLDVSIGERPLNDIRYSWNQYNNPGLVWDYKIALAGLNEIHSATWFDTFGIQTSPYEALPNWVSQQRWEWGTLVANEGGGAPSSEGIYEWSATNLFQADSGEPASRLEGSQIEIRQYLAGNADQLPEDIYHQIRTGMRGEFGYLYDQPTLYFSPIDHKLHLSNASRGTWNLGEGYQIHTTNLDQDETLDQWILKRDDRVLKQLNAHCGMLIYQDIED
jgi:hypothetical protein